MGIWEHIKLCQRRGWVRLVAPGMDYSRRRPALNNLEQQLLGRPKAVNNFPRHHVSLVRCLVRFWPQNDVVLGGLQITVFLLTAGTRVLARVHFCRSGKGKGQALSTPKLTPTTTTNAHHRQLSPPPPPLAANCCQRLAVGNLGKNLALYQIW